MQSKLLEAPVLEPFTLAEVKAALRVTHDIHDDLIWGLARSARKLCEDAARISISPQLWISTFRAPMRSGDEFGLTDSITDPERILTRLVIPRPPVKAVVSVALVHRNGRERIVMDPLAGQYYFDPNWYSLTWSAETQRALTDPYWPTLEVTYAAGYDILNPGAQNPIVADRTKRQVDCDDSIREAIFVTTAAGYDDPDGAMSKVPQRAIEVLRPYWNQPRYSG